MPHKDIRLWLVAINLILDSKYIYRGSILPSEVIFYFHPIYILILKTLCKSNYKHIFSSDIEISTAGEMFRKKLGVMLQTHSLNPSHLILFFTLNS